MKNPGFESPAKTQLKAEGNGAEIDHLVKRDHGTRSFGAKLHLIAEVLAAARIVHKFSHATRFTGSSGLELSNIGCN